MTAEDLKNILAKLATTDPRLFLLVLDWSEKFGQLQNGPTPGPLVPGQIPGTTAATSASGRDYTLRPSAISDEDKSALRQGLADGIAIDRAVSYLQGLLTGVTLAGGGL